MTRPLSLTLDRFFCTPIAFLVGATMASQLLATDYTLPYDTGISPQALSLAGVQQAETSAPALFLNPAALYAVQHASTSLFYTTFVAEQVHSFHLATALRFNDDVISIGTFQTRIPNNTEAIDDGTNQGLAIGSFSVTNALYKLGYTHSFSPTLHAGASLSYFYNDLHATTGQGCNLDLGLLYILPNSSFAFGVQNIIPNSKVSYSNGQTETLPTQLAWSAAYEPTSEWTIFSQLKSRFGSSNTNLLKSAAIQYKPFLLKNILSFSLGWQEFMALDQVQNKAAFGLSLSLNQVSLHFAYENSDVTDAPSHYAVSLAYDL